MSWRKTYISLQIKEYVTNYSEKYLFIMVFHYDLVRTYGTFDENYKISRVLMCNSDSV